MQFVVKHRGLHRLQPVAMGLHVLLAPQEKQTAAHDTAHKQGSADAGSKNDGFRGPHPKPNVTQEEKMCFGTCTKNIRPKSHYEARERGGARSWA